MRRIAAAPLFTVEYCVLPSPAPDVTIRGSRRPRSNQESAMGETTPGTPPSVNPPEDRLDSWKEIAAYLNRDVTTVQRWEKREGMPVHRHLHDRSGSVYAFRSELDAWSRSRSAQPAAESDDELTGEFPVLPAPQAPSPRTRNYAIAIAATLAALAAIAIGWYERSDHFWRNPLAGALYQSVTGFGGQNEAAAVSRDGKFVAFLSDRGGRTDVWVTQLGSGQ